MPKIFNHKYRALAGYEVTKEIVDIFEEQCPLSLEQRNWLRESLGNCGINGNLDMPFQAYSWEDNYPTGRNSWWRFTVLFFLVAIILCQPLLFFFWIKTGCWCIPRDTKISKFMIKWSQNIFER